MEIGTDIFLVDKDAIRKDPAADGAIDSDGRVKILSIEFWQQYSRPEIATFCNRYAVYHLPTIEFIDWLRVLLGDVSAIEIGAGSGILAGALGIPATDNHMQTWPDIRRVYDATRQPIITYGANVACMGAIEALQNYRPQVALAAWVTHKFDPLKPGNEGNAYGPDEREILKLAGSYVFIGNTVPHRKKPLLKIAHRTMTPPGILSRSMSGGIDVVWIWGNALPGEKEARALCG